VNVPPLFIAGAHTENGGEIRYSQTKLGAAQRKRDVENPAIKKRDDFPIIKQDGAVLTEEQFNEWMNKAFGSPTK
jgi:hypothetical protein